MGKTHDDVIEMIKGIIIVLCMYTYTYAMYMYVSFCVTHVRMFIHVMIKIHTLYIPTYAKLSYTVIMRPGVRMHWTLLVDFGKSHLFVHTYIHSHVMLYVKAELKLSKGQRLSKF